MTAAMRSAALPAPEVSPRRTAARAHPAHQPAIRASTGSWARAALSSAITQSTETNLYREQLTTPLSSREPESHHERENSWQPRMERREVQSWLTTRTSGHRPSTNDDLPPTSPRSPASG